MLKLIEFINSNEDWETKLSEKPYCVQIKRKDNFIIFNYSQIDSDFNNPIVRECRGIILTDKSFKPVCVPFYKFGNYGEGYCPDIDWDSARIQEKVDGSLIKVWCHNAIWHVSTNGNIDARDSKLPYESEFNNFYELFMKAYENAGLSIGTLNKKYTTMFELTSPYNRVVVDYKDVSIRYIGTRDNETLEELDIDIGAAKPKLYDIMTLEQCIESANNLPFNNEGYVVVDKYWNRVKIKSPTYITLHYFKTSNLKDITMENLIERIIPIVKSNQQEEFLVYLPEFFNEIEHIKDVISKIGIECCAMESLNFESRKDFAINFANKSNCPEVMFAYYDKKFTMVEDYLFSKTDKKLASIIIKYDKKERNKNV